MNKRYYSTVIAPNRTPAYPHPHPQRFGQFISVHSHEIFFLKK